MAARNEEKLISKALNRLQKVKLDYQNIQVLVGLHKCTDKTEEIVDQYHFCEKVIVKEGAGKQQVLETLVPYINGEIIIIHDADWTFEYKNKQFLTDYIHLFDDKKIGGIADSFPAAWPKSIHKITSIPFLINSVTGDLLLRFQKKYYTKRQNGKLFVDKNKMIFPFFLDAFKKESEILQNSNKKLTAGDHIERTHLLLQKNYEIQIIEDRSYPHFEVNYTKQTLKDIIQQKTRGFLARDKVRELYQGKKPGFLNFNLPFLLFCFKNLWRYYNPLQFLLFGLGLLLCFMQSTKPIN